MKTRIVVATRLPSQRDFVQGTPTGRSLAALGSRGVEVRLFAANSRGLPAVYNEAIEEAGDDELNLVFLHDDVLLVDFFWLDRVAAGLEEYDIIGVAGNRRRQPRQPSWYHTREWEWDTPENLSGIVGHGSGFPSGQVTSYGEVPRQVVLLDGVMLAASNRTLKRSGLRFDERFAFHFYDLDFCREAEARGLRMGTWPISIIHASGGRLGAQDWHKAYETYLGKWGS